MTDDDKDEELWLGVLQRVRSLLVQFYFCAKQCYICKCDSSPNMMPAKIIFAKKIQALAWLYGRMHDYHVDSGFDSSSNPGLFFLLRITAVMDPLPLKPAVVVSSQQLTLQKVSFFCV